MITGARSGLGAHIADSLMREPMFQGDSIALYDIKDGNDVRRPYASHFVVQPELDILINCAGINRTGWLEDVTSGAWDDVMDVNAKGIFTMTQWALPGLIKRKGTVLNIVSNASHMPMTCSAAYNASKGAAHILTLQLARELTKRHGITVFGISPNKLRGTEMSHDIERQVCEQRGWTPEFAAEYQRNALLTGEETDPAQLAEFIAYLLSHKDRHKFLTGTVIPYGA